MLAEKDSDTDIYHVTVEKGDATSTFSNDSYNATVGGTISLPKGTIYIKELQKKEGATYAPKYEFVDKEVEIPLFSYTSEEPNVASVDAQGNVTAHAAGVAKKLL